MERRERLQKSDLPSGVTGRKVPLVNNKQNAKSVNSLRHYQAPFAILTRSSFTLSPSKTHQRRTKSASYQCYLHSFRRICEFTLALASPSCHSKLQPCGGAPICSLFSSVCTSRFRQVIYIRMRTSRAQRSLLVCQFYNIKFAAASRFLVFSSTHPRCQAL